MKWDTSGDTSGNLKITAKLCPADTVFYISGSNTTDDSSHSSRHAADFHIAFAVTDLCGRPSNTAYAPPQIIPVLNVTGAAAIQDHTFFRPSPCDEPHRHISKPIFLFFGVVHTDIRLNMCVCNIPGYIWHKTNGYVLSLMLQRQFYIFTAAALY